MLLPENLLSEGQRSRIHGQQNSTAADNSHKMFRLGECVNLIEQQQEVSEVKWSNVMVRRMDEHSCNCMMENHYACWPTSCIPVVVLNCLQIL